LSLLAAHALRCQELDGALPIVKHDRSLTDPFDDTEDGVVEAVQENELGVDRGEPGSERLGFFRHAGWSGRGHGGTRVKGVGWSPACRTRTAGEKISGIRRAGAM